MAHTDFALRIIHEGILKRTKKTNRRRNSLCNKYFYNRLKQEGCEALEGVSPKEFRAILLEYNKELTRELMSKGMVVLPAGLGMLYLSMGKRQPRFTKGSGELTNLGKMDWKGTLELWERDPQSYAEKRLVRFVTDYVYKVNYVRYKYTKNSIKWRLVVTDCVKNALRDAVNDGTVNVCFEHK